MCHNPQLNVSEIVQLSEIREVFRGTMFMPRTWNNGMMEYWNVDFKEIFSFMEFDFKKIFPINHCHIFPEPIVPSFHYSNCEAKFSLKPSRKAGWSKLCFAGK